MDFKEYKEIRDEAKECAKRFVDGLPEHFTMLHLECLKIVVSEVIDNTIGDIKARVTLNLMHLLQSPDGSLVEQIDTGNQTKRDRR